MYINGQTLSVPFPSDEVSPFIYVCYAHADRERVFPVIRRIYEQGWRVWYDEGAQINDHYSQVLRDHVDRCALFLLMLSSEAARSNSIVTREVPYALELEKPIVICMLDEAVSFPSTDLSVFPSVNAEDLEKALHKTAGLEQGLPREAVSLETGVSLDSAAKDLDYAFEPCIGGVRLGRYKGTETVVNIPEGYPAGLADRVVETKKTFFDNDTVGEVHFPYSLHKIGYGTFSGFLERGREIHLYIPSSVREFDKNWYVDGGAGKQFVFHCVPGSAAWKMAEGVDYVRAAEDPSMDVSNREILTEEKIENPEQPDFIYETENGGLTLVRYTGEGEAVLKSSYFGFPLKRIAPRAFAGREDLCCVRLPDTITEIGKGAFADCTQLRELYLPEGLTAIEENLADGCRMLSVVTIPATVTVIGDYAFRNCQSLEQVSLPSALEEIGRQPFYGCGSLAGLSVPASVKKIGDSAFEDQVSLKEIHISDGVREIGKRAFYKCTSLGRLSLPESVCTVGEEAFGECSGLKEVHLPKTGEEYGARAFTNCTALQEIRLPEGLTELRTGLLRGCEALEEVSLPSSLMGIFDYAFEGCVSLKEIRIPDLVQYIGWETFKGCTGMHSFTFPKGMKSIKSQSFMNLDWLQEVIISEGTEDIGSYAFSGCENLRCVKLPQSLRSISGNAFQNCVKLAEIHMPDHLEEFGKEALKNCGLETIVIPEGIRELPESLLSGCTPLKHLILPESLEKIQKSALQGCSSLREVSIPPGTAYIGEKAFQNCAGLERISLPDEIKEIGRSTFQGCTGLLAVEFPEGLETIRGAAFSGCSSLREVCVSAGIQSIDSGAFAYCSALSEITVSPQNTNFTTFDGALIREGTLVCCPAGKKGRFVIPPEVTWILECAFEGCMELTEIVIPDSVEGIGWAAFRGCSSLVSAPVPKSVREIRGHIFDGCDMLPEDQKKEAEERSGIRINTENNRNRKQPKKSFLERLLSKIGF